MHIPQNISMEALTRNYQIHATPPVVHMQRLSRIAVALDCEMGTAVSGDSEPIRVTLIDYFSGEILVDNIIVPDVRMHHLNTKYSGVSWDDMNKAKRQRTCLWGNVGTREALWPHIGEETIVVGHGASNDLRALRWMHRSVVDSLIIESTRAKRADLRKAAEQESADEGCVGAKGDEGDIRPTPCSTTASGIAEPSVETSKVPVMRKPGQLSLKTLAKLRLGREIQTNGKKGHDSLEDAVAARDLVHWSITNPDEVSH
jgi:DNA polymerase III epsilon subunit-like protein